MQQIFVEKEIGLDMWHGSALDTTKLQTPVEHLPQQWQGQGHKDLG